MPDTSIQFRPLLGLMLSLTVSVLLLSCRGLLPDLIQPDAVKYCNLVLILLGLLAMMILWAKFDQYREDGARLQEDHREHLGLDYFLSARSHLLAVFVFGICAIASDMMYLVSDLSCMKTFIDRERNSTNGYSLTQVINAPFSPSSDEEDFYSLQNQIARVVLTFIEMVFFLLLIPFLCKLFSVTKRVRRCRSHSLLLLIITANFGIWLYSFYRESGLFGVLPLAEDIKEVDSNFTLACLNHTTAADVWLQSMQLVIYPFCMEFSLVALQVLISVWFLKVDDEGMDSVAQVDYVALEDDDLVQEQEQTETSDLNWAQKVWLKLISFNSFYTACATGIFEAVLMKVFLLNEEMCSLVQNYLPAEVLEMDIEVPTLIYRIVVIQLPAVLVVCHLYAKIRKHRIKRQDTGTISGTYVIIGLAVMADTALTLFEFILCVSKATVWDQYPPGHLPTYAVSLLESIMSLTQYIVQALLIYHAKTYTSRSHNLQAGHVEGLMEYLIMFNFMRWCKGTFLDTEFKTGRVDIEQKASSSVISSWNGMVYVLRPPIIYYRYMSTFLLVGIKYLWKRDGMGHTS